MQSSGDSRSRGHVACVVYISGVPGPLGYLILSDTGLTILLRGANAVVSICVHSPDMAFSTRLVLNAGLSDIVGHY